MKKTTKSRPTKRAGFFHDKKRLAAYGVMLILVLTLGGLYAYRWHHESQLITVTAPDGNGSVTLRRSDYEKSLQDTKPIIVDGNSLHPCIGNKHDQCRSAPSLDFWPVGSEGAYNPAYAPGDSKNNKEIMGRITQINDASVVIQSSSGTAYTINFPIDAVSNYNTNFAPNNGVTVGLGDMLHVDYNQSASDTSTTIAPNQLFKTSLLLKDINLKQHPDAPPEKY